MKFGIIGPLQNGLAPSPDAGIPQFLPEISGLPQSMSAEK